MTGTENIGTAVTQLQYDPATVQSSFNIILWIGIGIAAAAFVGYLLWTMYQRMQYKYKVTVIERLGKGEVQYETSARKYKDRDGVWKIDYLGVGVSPVFKDLADHLRNVKKKMFGLIPQAFQGFTVYKVGNEMRLINVEPNPGLKVIDYDMVNFMQQLILDVVKKHEQVDEWKQLMPYIALGIVVIGFVLMILFYGKHIENVAGMILGASNEAADKILQSGGNLQVLQ